MQPSITDTGSGILGKHSGLRAYVERLQQDEAKAHLSALLERYHVKIENLADDLESLAEVDSKASSRISKMVGAFASMHQIDLKKESGLKKLEIELDTAKDRLTKWSERFDKVKNFVTNHVGEISAAALGMQGWKSSWAAMDTAVDTMVSTTGELGSNWDSAAGHALKMSAQLLDVQTSAAGLVEDIEGLTDWQRKYYALFRSSGDAAVAIKGMAALTHSFGVDISEMTEMMESRQKSYNQTAEETTMELAGIHSQFRRVYENIEATGTAAQKSARIWENDYYQSVKEAASEINESGTDMHSLAKILSSAYTAANKLNISYNKSKEIMSDVGKLFKLPETMQVEGADEIIKEIQSARRSGQNDEAAIYKSYFRDTDIEIAKTLIGQIESGAISGQFGSEQLFSLISKTGRGLAKTFSLQKKFLTELGPIENQVAFLRERLGVKEPYLVRELVMSGKLDDVISSMQASGKSPEEVQKAVDQMIGGDKAKVEQDLAKLEGDANLKWRQATNTMKALISNPITSLLGSLTIFTTSALLRRYQNKKIEALLLAQQVAVEEIRAASGVQGPLPDVGGKAGKGNWFSRLFRRGGGGTAAAVTEEVAGVGAKAAGAASTEAGAAASALGKEAGALRGAGPGIARGLAGASTRLAGFGTKAIPIVGTALAAGVGIYETAEAYKTGGAKAAAVKGSGVLGGLGGTALGAAIGTMIAPGIGTLIGAGLGGLIGSLATEKVASRVASEVSNGKSPDMGDTSSMNKSAEVLVNQLRSAGLDNPQALASAASAMRGQNGSHPGSATVDSPSPTLTTKAKGFGQNGTLVLELTNPEVISTMVGAYARHA